MLNFVLPERIIDESSCVFNDGIRCTQHDKCEKCGWNPDNIPGRKQAAREAYENMEDWNGLGRT